MDGLAIKLIVALVAVLAVGLTFSALSQDPTCHSISRIPLEPDAKRPCQRRLPSREKTRAMPSWRPMATRTGETGTETAVSGSGFIRACARFKMERLVPAPPRYQLCTTFAGLDSKSTARHLPSPPIVTAVHVKQGTNAVAAIPPAPTACNFFRCPISPLLAAVEPRDLRFSLPLPLL